MRIKNVFNMMVMDTRGDLQFLTFLLTGQVSGVFLYARSFYAGNLPGFLQDFLNQFLP